MAIEGKQGMIVRQTAPLNLETPFAQISDSIVPVESFFVRNHFPAPDISSADWRLTVSGAVERSVSLSLDDISAFPRAGFEAVVECAGNGRVFYEPARPGLQWQNGAVGNAAWSGVLLSDVLAHCGVSPGAIEAVLVGTDSGIVDSGQKTASPGPIAFARSLPIAKALTGEVLLATHMNGAPLTREHGFPMRAVVGGWYGMAWIKWLGEIRIVEKPFTGYWQMRDYFRWKRDLGEPRLTPLAEMEVKCQIARPVEGSRLPLGEAITIHGKAWSGHGGIASVEIAIDDGPWQQALLSNRETAYGWCGFSLSFTPDRLGRKVLRARATDRRGNIQPESQLPDRESYLANWIIPVGINIVEKGSDEGWVI
jgi:DMSO/TMAO reductase YedYZ molybdopterin-dependent catalytic subunit